MSTNNEVRGQGPLERGFLHVMQGITLIAFAAAGGMLINLSGDLREVRVELRQLNERIVDFRRLAEDRYTTTQAIRDLGAIDKILEDHEERIRALETQ